MSVFEFRPCYTVSKPLSIAEMAAISGKPETVIKSRIEQNRMHHLKGCLLYGVEDCAKVLNSKNDIENWRIEGYLTLVQTAARLGVVATTVHNLMKKLDIPYIQQTIVRTGSIWIDEADCEKMAEYLSEDEKGSYMTPRDIADVCFVDPEYVNVYAAKLGTRKKYIRFKLHYLKADCPALIAEVNRARAKGVCKKKAPAKPAYNMAEHPLVKDPRCFDDDWFPAHLPAYMAEW